MKRKIWSKSFKIKILGKFKIAKLTFQQNQFLIKIAKKGWKNKIRRNEEEENKGKLNEDDKIE